MIAYDDETEEMNEEGEEETDPNLVEIEKEFRAACKKAMPKIEEQLDIARKAIAKAEKLSEKYGVPFESDITPLSMSYVPGSMNEEFRKLDWEVVYDLTGAGLDEDIEGWEHSSIC